jgi:methionyl-tRNA synthetase
LPRHLVTSAPLRADGIGHLGNLAESTLPADVYSRFLRACGEEVLFVCATDEHGAEAEMAAAAASLDVAEHCARVHAAQAGLVGRFGISFDAFGRSSSPRNRQQTEYFAKRLEEEGYIEARSVRRLRDRRHLFLLRSKLAGELRSWLESRGHWPEPARSIGLEALDGGVGDFSITRDLPWGTPVGRSGFEGIAYGAEFDRPVAYIGATREWADALGETGAWRRWWCGSEDVRYVQFLPRADVETHAITFPAMIIGSREEWKLVDLIKTFDSLSYYGGRFAPGGEVAVAMDVAAELLPPDCWRYFLIAETPEAGGSSFSWEGLAAAVNGDLVDGFGRLVERSVGLALRCDGGQMPGAGEAGPGEALLAAEVEARVEACGARLGALEFRPAAAELRAAWASGNAYLDRQGTGEALGSEPERMALSARVSLNLAAFLARASSPLIPFASAQALDALAVPAGARGWPRRFEAEALPAAPRPSSPPRLFRRIEEAEVERWRSRAKLPAPAVADFNGSRKAISDGWEWNGYWNCKP